MLQNIDNNEVLTDYTCNGTCSKCGNCCTDLLPITNEEVKEIKKYVIKNNIKPEQRKFSDEIRIQCPFLNQKTKHCNIYKVRPYVCKDFLCNHEDWLERREKYMLRADYNGINKNGKLGKLRTMDELIFDNIEFLVYQVLNLMERMKYKKTTKNFEKIVKTLGRKDILKYLKFN